jgi:hypothetical protein
MTGFFLRLRMSVSNYTSTQTPTSTNFSSALSTKQKMCITEIKNRQLGLALHHNTPLNTAESADEESELKFENIVRCQQHSRR